MTREADGGGESAGAQETDSGENGEGGGGISTPRDCDPVRDESIPRPPKRNDHDHIISPPEIDASPASVNASGGYGTVVRPSGPSRVAESTVGVSGGSTLLPTIEIGNFNS